METLKQLHWGHWRVPRVHQRGWHDTTHTKPRFTHCSLVNLSCDRQKCLCLPAKWLRLPENTHTYTVSLWLLLSQSTVSVSRSLNGKHCGHTIQLCLQKCQDNATSAVLLTQNSKLITQSLLHNYYTLITQNMLHNYYKLIKLVTFVISYIYCN